MDNQKPNNTSGGVGVGAGVGAGVGVGVGGVGVGVASSISSVVGEQEIVVRLPKKEICSEVEEFVSFVSRHKKCKKC